MTRPISLLLPIKIQLINVKVGDIFLFVLSTALNDEHSVIGSGFRQVLPYLFSRTGQTSIRITCTDKPSYGILITFGWFCLSIIRIEFANKNHIIIQKELSNFRDDYETKEKCPKTYSIYSSCTIVYFTAIKCLVNKDSNCHFILIGFPVFNILKV